jgi:hypothetical protein
MKLHSKITQYFWNNGHSLERSELSDLERTEERGNILKAAFVIPIPDQYLHIIAMRNQDEML